MRIDSDATRISSPKPSRPRYHCYTAFLLDGLKRVERIPYTLPIIPNRTRTLPTGCLWKRLHVDSHIHLRPVVDKYVPDTRKLAPARKNGKVHTQEKYLSHRFEDVLIAFKRSGGIRVHRGPGASSGVQF
jgi:hypothetical protein